MADLGWRAQSSQLSRSAKPIEGLREDFGLRVRAAVEAMKEGEEASTSTAGATARKGRLNLDFGENKGVQARSQRDMEYVETDDSKELKRLAALERKALLYEKLSKGVDLDDEAANDLHEVDFIGKALLVDDFSIRDSPVREMPSSETSQHPQPPETMHPEEMVARQQAMRRQMQGGREEYSTYEQDMAELQARHKKVDELNELNAQRSAEFEAAKMKQSAKEQKKQKETAKHKGAILQQLLKKRQKLSSLGTAQ